MFKEDATFKRLPGLADPSAISFESYDYPGFFLWHDRDGHLWVERNDNSQSFKEDATFKEEDPRVPVEAKKKIPAVEVVPIVLPPLPKANSQEPSNNENAQPSASVVMIWKVQSLWGCYDANGCVGTENPDYSNSPTITFRSDGTFEDNHHSTGTWGQNVDSIYWIFDRPYEYTGSTLQMPEGPSDPIVEYIGSIGDHPQGAWFDKTRPDEPQYGCWYAQRQTDVANFAGDVRSKR